MSDNTIAYQIGQHFWDHRNDEPQYAINCSDLSQILQIPMSPLCKHVSLLKNKKRILDRRRPTKNEGRAELYFLREGVTESDIDALNGYRVSLTI